MSVLLPACNAEACAGRAIASILQQTLADFELILVENGSTDNTLQILKDWALRDARIRLLTLPTASIVGALNHGLAHARGAFIVRMDADDFSYPQRLQRQVHHLLRNPDIGLVSCLVRHAGDARRQAGYALYVDWINSLVTEQQIALHRFVESPLAHPSVCFRRELPECFGAWRNGNFPEDYELWLRWLDAGVRIAKIPEPLLDWHDPPTRLSRTDPRYAPAAFFAMKAEYLARWLRTGPAANRPLLIWGAGRQTRTRLRPLNNCGVEVSGWVDINPRQWGQRIEGLPVWSPQSMPAPRECFVISAVTNRGARELISAALEGRGFVLGQDYILAG